jgi:hypothetical protein
MKPSRPFSEEPTIRPSGIYRVMYVAKFEEAIYVCIASRRRLS